MNTVYSVEGKWEGGVCMMRGQCRVCRNRLCPKCGDGGECGAWIGYCVEC